MIAVRDETASKLPRRRKLPWGTLLAAVVILVPSCYGFGTKFFELAALLRGEVDGAFAIAPIVNYLLASAGFLMLLGWAAAHGMFHDLERPKQAMLDNEFRLDEQERMASLVEAPAVRLAAVRKRV